MKIYYTVTETSLKSIANYPWLKDNFQIGKLDDKDDREIVRLLENTHYSNIIQCLKVIDKYGEKSDEIGRNLLNCNDSISFGRYLSELFLFAYLEEKLDDSVKAVKRIEGQQTPDISVKKDELEFLIEIYTSMDFYGYQCFVKLITQTIKNLDIELGFDITTKLKSDNFFYEFDFPNFRDVYKWIENYEKNVLKFLKSAKKGDSFESILFIDSVKFITILKHIYKDKNVRSVVSNHKTRSNDTKLFFEIDDPKRFAETQWGVKLKDKISKKQAGDKKEGVLRVLAINFSHSDTTDISFFNNKKYYNNLVNDIIFLASDIEPYPPFDVILPCDLGLNSGFIKPINLSDYKDSKIEEMISAIHLDNSLEKFPDASKKEIDQIFKSMLEVIDEDSH